MDPITTDPQNAIVTCRRCGSTFTATTVTGPLTGRRVQIERPFCDACEERIATEEAETAKRNEADARERRRQKAVADLDAPPLYAGVSVYKIRADWGSHQQQERTGRALIMARRIVGEISGGLTPPPLVGFVGRPGNGKTLICWAIAQDLASRYGLQARVVRLSDLIRDLRANWGRRQVSGPSDAARIQAYAAPSFLAIDEVTRDAFFGSARQHLIDVIEARIIRCRCTVLTSNEDLEGLEAILGPALMSRLALGGIVRFGDTEDFRQLPVSERAAAAATGGPAE